MYNPSLRQEPRNQRAPIIPLQQESSILDWLEKSGRLLSRDDQDFDYEEIEEISELMAVDDGSYDVDDDDDDDLLDLDE